MKGAYNSACNLNYLSIKKQPPSVEEAPIEKENLVRVANATDHFIRSIKNATNNPADLIIKRIPSNLTLFLYR